jgi:hypothetical protein
LPLKLDRNIRDARELRLGVRKAKAAEIRDLVSFRISRED